MKITTVRPPVEFVPVKIVLEIDSLAELRGLRNEIGPAPWGPLTNDLFAVVIALLEKEI